MISGKSSTSSQNIISQGPTAEQQNFFCPITKQLLVWPVKLDKKDKRWFEKSALENWKLSFKGKPCPHPLNRGDKCQMPNELNIDWEFKKSIEIFLQQNPEVIQAWAESHNMCIPREVVAEFIQAITERNISAIKKLISESFIFCIGQFEQFDQFGTKNILQLTCIMGDYDLTKFIIETIATHCKKDFLKQYILQKEQYGLNAVQLAAIYNRQNIVALLLDKLNISTASNPALEFCLASQIFYNLSRVHQIQHVSCELYALAQFEQNHQDFLGIKLSLSRVVFVSDLKQNIESWLKKNPSLASKMPIPEYLSKLIESLLSTGANNELANLLENNFALSLSVLRPNTGENIIHIISKSLSTKLEILKIIIAQLKQNWQECYGVLKNQQDQHEVSAWEYLYRFAGDAVLGEVLNLSKKDFSFAESDFISEKNWINQWLMNAIKESNPDFIDTCFLVGKPDINCHINIESMPKATFLHYAVQIGNLEIVRKLVAMKANIEAKGSAGLTPLHYAVKLGKQTLVEFFTSVCKQDVNVQDDSGNTVLHALLNAILENKKRNIKIDNALLKFLLTTHNFNMSLKNKDGNTIVDLIWRLPEHKRDMILEISTKRCLWDLAIAITNVKEDKKTYYLLQIFINQCGQDGYAQDGSGNIALQSVLNAMLESKLININIWDTLLKFLLIKNFVLSAENKKTMVVLIKRLSKEQQSDTLQLASEAGYWDLLIAVAKTEKIDQVNMTQYDFPLSAAARANNTIAVSVLLNAGGNVLRAPLDTETGNSPIHWAVVHGNLEMLNIMLSAMGADSCLKLKNKKKQTAFQLAAKLGYWQLLAPMASVRDNAYRRSYDLIGSLKIRGDVLSLAVEKNKTTVVLQLINKMLLRDDRDNPYIGNYTLHFAITNKNSKVLKALLSVFEDSNKGAIQQLEQKNQAQQTPLQHAAYLGDWESVNAIVDFLTMKRTLHYPEFKEISLCSHQIAITKIFAFANDPNEKSLLTIFTDIYNIRAQYKGTNASRLNLVDKIERRALESYSQYKQGSLSYAALLPKLNQSLNTFCEEVIKDHRENGSFLSKSSLPFFNTKSNLAKLLKPIMGKISANLAQNEAREIPTLS